MTKTKDYILDEQIGYLFRLANQRHTAIFQKLTLDDLTPTQFAAMVRVDELGEVSQNELGRKSAMDVATIKGVVGRLQDRGLITLRPDLSDKRRTLISLSKPGKTLLRKMRRIGLEISDQTLAPLTATEQKTLMRLLKKLC